MCMSCFMLRFLIYLDLKFVWGEKYEFSFIYLHADTQLDLQHLLKMLSFSIVHFSFFVKHQVFLNEWFYFCEFSSIALSNMSLSVTIPFSCYHYSSVVYLVIKDGDSPRSSFTFKNFFLLFWVFCLSRWIWYLVFPCLWRVLLLILMGIALNL